MALKIRQRLATNTSKVSEQSLPIQRVRLWTSSGSLFNTITVRFNKSPEDGNDEVVGTRYAEAHKGI